MTQPGYNFYKDNRKWHKVSAEHFREYLGKTYKVNHCSWEPGNKYNGKKGKVVDTYISWYDSNVTYIELDIAPGVAYTLNELREI